MESTNTIESNSTGSMTPILPTGDRAPETKPEKLAKEARSTKQSDSSQQEPDSSWIELPDALGIFQEDLRVLRKVGAQFKIIPDLKPLGKTVIVFENIGFENGDFFLKSRGS